MKGHAKHLGIALALPIAAAAATASGTVALDDGEPRIEPIEVKIRCAGEIVAETEADERGRFELKWKSAAEPCRAEAYQPGYEPAALPVDALPAIPEIPSLTLHRTGKAQGETVSATFLAAPEQARRAFERGFEHLRAGEYGQGEEALARAVEIDTGYAAAWFELARLSLAADDASAARVRFAKAVEADPWFVPPYEPLLLLDMQAGRWQSVRKLAAQMLAMNPNLPRMRYRRALAALQLGDVEQARADVDALAGERVPGLERLRARLAREVGR